MNALEKPPCHMGIKTQPLSNSKEALFALLSGHQTEPKEGFRLAVNIITRQQQDHYQFVLHDHSQLILE